MSAGGAMFSLERNNTNYKIRVEIPLYTHTPTHIKQYKSIGKESHYQVIWTV